MVLTKGITASGNEMDNAWDGLQKGGFVERILFDFKCAPSIIIQIYTPFVVDPRLKTLSFFELGCSPGSLQQINLFFIPTVFTRV